MNSIRRVSLIPVLNADLPVAPNPRFHWTSAAVLAGILAASSLAIAQNDPAIPDAQVQANVLRALAGAPELAGEDIHTRTVYGVVSLSGNVRTETLQARAENLAAQATGVKKVIDEMHVGPETLPGASTQTPVVAAQQSAPHAPLAPHPDGPAVEAQSSTPPLSANGQPAPGSAPASAAVMNNPEDDQRQYQTQSDPGAGDPSQPAAGGGYQQPAGGYQQPGYADGSGYPNQAQPGYPSGPGGYNQPPMQGGPGYPGAPEYGRYSNQGQPGMQHNRRYGAYTGQAAGKPIVIPDDTVLHVRLNQTISSDHSAPGNTFDGIVMNDVVAQGAIAIPRGAEVHGSVISATRAGVLKGRGDLSIALNSVTLGGQTFPLVTKPWAHHGGDKTIETVNKTAGFGAVGAVVGALAGGGEGAAIGGGIGAAAGLGSSATSGRGQVYLPAEAVITFRLAQDASVTTVSQQEMDRLAYGSSPNLQPRYPRRRAYPQVYVAPGYYPGYYPGPYAPYPGYYPPPYGYPPPY